MRFTVLPILSLGLLGLLGCEELPFDRACDASLAYSLHIDVEDADGVPTDASVRYASGDADFVDCESYDTGSYVCGEEVSGVITVEVERDGEVQTEEFAIERDECHVIGQSMTFVVPSN